MHTIATRALLWVSAVVLVGGALSAQTPAASASVAQKNQPSIFAPLTLAPAPSATRLTTGAPGPKYWQNRADYDLKVTIDTATHMLSGSMVLRYTNNSPDALKEFWFQTERSKMVIDRFDQVVNGTSVSLGKGTHPRGDVYELQMALAEPLEPGKTTTFQVEWHYPIPEPTRITGPAGTLYEVAQWYPRPNVYDDVKGWNTESLSTGGEYYLEYGDFQLAVTLPSNYIVAATGTLDNPIDVLTTTQIARLTQAATVDTVVRIITAAELKNGTARPKREGMLTWKFHAKNVRDAVWSAAPDYQWDATHWKTTLAQAFYQPARASVWEDAAEMVRMSIQEYSERWFPYPYPQVSVAEGREPPSSYGGTEYPMFSIISTAPSKPQHYAVITHEVGHNWFPMIVGSNERIHMWMDEGFVTFIQSFSEARRYSQGSDQRARIGKMVFSDGGDVLETGAVNNTVAAYAKTGYVLELLRSVVLGPEVFDKAFRVYLQRWAYKHPTPIDFFRTMEDVSRRKLDWFWRTCFLEAPRLDQAIDSVSQTVRGAEAHVTVTYGNKGRAVMPLLVHFTFSDSTTQDVTYPAEVWQANPAAYTVSYTFSKKTVRRIGLDPKEYLPDASRSNNDWTAK